MNSNFYNNNNNGYNMLGGRNTNTPGNDNLYQELGRLRNAPYNQYRTVFNDIADEWGNCSEDERRFIESDADYMQANVAYAQQFNAFLLDQFGLQFANSKYGTSAEQVLITLRNARGKYRTNAIEDVAKIKSENALLQKQIKELEDIINAN
jgi:hypothetical protein